MEELFGYTISETFRSKIFTIEMIGNSLVALFTGYQSLIKIEKYHASLNINSLVYRIFGANAVDKNIRTKLGGAAVPGVNAAFILLISSIAFGNVIKYGHSAFSQSTSPQSLWFISTIIIYWISLLYTFRELWIQICLTVIHAIFIAILFQLI